MVTLFLLFLCVYCIVYSGIYLQGFPDQNRNIFIILTVASNSLFDFSIKLTTLSDAPLCRILWFPQSGELSREKPAAVSCKSLFTFQNDQAPRHSVHGYARNTHTVEKCSVLVNYTLVRCFCVTPTFWTWFQIIVANTRLKAGGCSHFLPVAFWNPSKSNPSWKCQHLGPYHEKPSSGDSLTSLK